MSAALTPARVEAGFWLILWISLAAGIGVETDWGRQMQWPLEKPAQPSADFAKPVLTEPYSLPNPEQYLGISLRPIFVVTRRPPPVAPAAEPPKPSMKRDQFILAGTMIIPEGKFAVLVEKAGHKTRVVAEGKEINGIMVKAVKADQVTLSQYDDTEVLVLKTAVSPAGAPVPGKPAFPGMAGVPGGQPRAPAVPGVPAAPGEPAMGAGAPVPPGARRPSVRVGP